MAEGLLDFGRGELVPYGDLLEELIAILASDARAFGCLKEVEAASTILERGTSADRQRDTYQRAIEAGAAPEEALRAVVDRLIAETVMET
jgi:carboxylate-amine ligase